MNYQLTIAIKKRKCNYCSGEIPAGNKHFVMNDWPRHQDYPTKKNFCLDCATKITDTDFVSFLRFLLQQLENLKSFQTMHKEPTAKTTSYVCNYCKHRVLYNEALEAFSCTHCNNIFEDDELQELTKIDTKKTEPGSPAAA